MQQQSVTLARPKRRKRRPTGRPPGRPPGQRPPLTAVPVYLPQGVLQQLRRQSEATDTPMSLIARSIIVRALAEPDGTRAAS